LARMPLVGNRTLATNGILANGHNDTISGAGKVTVKTDQPGVYEFHVIVTDPTGKLTLSAPVDDNGGPLNLVKSGPGTLVVNAANTYTGSTELLNGTLKYTHDQ